MKVQSFLPFSETATWNPVLRIVWNVGGVPGCVMRYCVSVGTSSIHFS